MRLEVFRRKNKNVKKKNAKTKKSFGGKPMDGKERKPDDSNDFFPFILAGWPGVNVFGDDGPLRMIFSDILPLRPPEMLNKKVPTID